MNKEMFMLKAKDLFCQVLIVCVMCCLFACSDKEKEDFSDISGVQNETWSDVLNCGSEGEVFAFTFEALDKWMAVSSDDWCKVLPTSGNKGKSNLKIVVDWNGTAEIRSTTITIKVEGHKDVVIFLEQEKVEIPPLEVNIVMDNYLVEKYLWNEEYKELSRDLTIPYRGFNDNFLRTTLMGMTTNTLDKKRRITDYDAYGNPIYGYTLYSYIERMQKGRVSRNISAMTGVNHGIEKDEMIRSYGLSRIAGISFVDDIGNATGEYGFAVQAVYPNSVASTFGVKRGTIITQIDGKKITDSNYVSSYLKLLNSTQSNIKLLVESPDSISEVLLASTMSDPTPILVNKVFEDGANRIGYLVYDSFNAAYDNDLLDVMADFKSKGITDLVLDLRNNGGGHVISANMLSSCLIGEGCRDKIFHYYRYNAERMADVEGTQKETENMYDEAIGLFGEKYMYDDYFGVNLASYSLDLKRLFVLTTQSTASASEVVINALQGYGIPVIIIGEETNGKNVGMETKRFNSEGYTYEFAPITFQGYNAKKETVPSDGFPVDYAVSDWNNGYVDFGDLNEPMLKKAYELITGSSRAIIAPSFSRRKVNGRIMNLPAAYKHPEGMIVRGK